ncbi:collagen alpha-1(XVII) chain-like [Halichondria panicea]|uniref:collagen alpha-1(XVII) chain-like n=1 Tax=Halichondria panicea TaxID=6063 RepID=UPI00312B5BA3
MGSNVKSILVAAFVLLTITLYGGLSFAVWNLKSENSNLQNQITKLQDIVEAKNSNPHSSDEATVMGILKRLTRQSGSSQSATDLLADALAELIEKKLYTIMECTRNDADNLTDCSLKPGPKGNKGGLGDQGPQGINGESGVKGHIGYPGHKGEVGPNGPIGDPGPMGHRGVKGDMGEIGKRGDTGVKGEQGLKGHYGFPGHKGESGGPGAKGVKGIEALEAIMEERNDGETRSIGTL